MTLDSQLAVLLVEDRSVATGRICAVGRSGIAGLYGRLVPWARRHGIRLIDIRPTG